VFTQKALGLTLPPSLWNWDGLIPHAARSVRTPYGLKPAFGNSRQLPCRCQFATPFTYKYFPDAPSNSLIQQSSPAARGAKVFWFDRFSSRDFIRKVRSPLWKFSTYVFRRCDRTALRRLPIVCGSMPPETSFRKAGLLNRIRISLSIERPGLSLSSLLLRAFTLTRRFFIRGMNHHLSGSPIRCSVRTPEIPAAPNARFAARAGHRI